MQDNILSALVQRACYFSTNSLGAAGYQGHGLICYCHAWLSLDFCSTPGLAKLGVTGVPQFVVLPLPLYTERAGLRNS